MGGKQDRRQEPDQGREEQGRQRPGDPARPTPGKPGPAREQASGQARTAPPHGRDEDLLRAEDLHDERL
ncbi:hypothetical protein ACGFXC_04670 [Streptomyces sp. NPDC048507]|uniref:hypothetical protein n=1 Tax=Streptomyces sp. NPDC048507 TaxID=3365560 RepID=UPI0037217BBC